MLFEFGLRGRGMLQLNAPDPTSVCCPSTTSTWRLSSARFWARSASFWPVGSAVTVPEIVSPAAISSGRFTLITPCGVVKVVMESPSADLESTRYPAAFCAAARGANGVFAIAIAMKVIAIKAAPATRASKAEALLFVFVMDSRPNKSVGSAFQTRVAGVSIKPGVKRSEPQVDIQHEDRAREACHGLAQKVSCMVSGPDLYTKSELGAIATSQRFNS